MTEKSEKVIQGEIMHALSMNGCTVFRTNAGKVRLANGGVVELLPKGYPDLTGFRKSDGKFVVIEVKKATGRLSEHQKKFAEWAKTQPIIYGVARSKEDAIHIIENGLNGYGV